MLAEFVVSYVPFAIAVVILLPIVLVHVAMFIEALRTKRWASPSPSLGRNFVAAGAPSAPAPAAARVTSPQPPRRVRADSAPIVTGGLGLRHGMAARHDHD